MMVCGKAAPVLAALYRYYRVASPSEKGNDDDDQRASQEVYPFPYYTVYDRLKRRPISRNDSNSNWLRPRPPPSLIRACELLLASVTTVQTCSEYQEPQLRESQRAVSSAERAATQHGARLHPQSSLFREAQSTDFAHKSDPRTVLEKLFSLRTEERNYSQQQEGCRERSPSTGSLDSSLLQHVLGSNVLELALLIPSDVLATGVTTSERDTVRTNLFDVLESTASGAQRSPADSPPNPFSFYNYGARGQLFSRDSVQCRYADLGPVSLNALLSAAGLRSNPCDSSCSKCRSLIVLGNITHTTVHELTSSASTAFAKQFATTCDPLPPLKALDDVFPSSHCGKQLLSAWSRRETSNQLSATESGHVVENVLSPRRQRNFVQVVQPWIADDRLQLTDNPGVNTLPYDSQCLEVLRQNATNVIVQLLLQRTGSNDFLNMGDTQVAMTGVHWFLAALRAPNGTRIPLTIASAASVTRDVTAALVGDYVLVDGEATKQQCPGSSSTLTCALLGNLLR